jgi:hypothetical protein
MIQPQDRAKVGVLVVGILVIFGLIGRTVLSQGGGSSAPVTPEAVGTSLADGSLGGSSGGTFDPAGGPSTGTRVVSIPPSDAPMSNIDPFRPVLRGDSDRAATTSSSEPPRREMDLPPTRPFDPSMGGGMLASGEGPVSIQPIAAERLKLEGVLLAEQSLAVLSGGGSTRIVGLGDSVPGGWVVSNIEAGGVTLEQGKRRRLVRVGEDLFSLQP